MTPNSHQDFEYGFQYFQGFTNWRTTTVRPSGTLESYQVEIPSYFRFLKESGKYEEPVYTEEEYTRWRTTTYEITDHAPENWKDKQITVKISPEYNYENKITLHTKSKEGIQATTEKTIVKPNSKASTKLTINPSNEIKESTHSIQIKAYDSKGNHIHTKHYTLKLNTKPKPAKQKRKINETITDKKPDQEGKSSSGRQKNFIGVRGTLRDSKTNERLHSGADHATVHVKRNHFNGNANWPIATEYEHSQYTYQDKSWTMTLTARASGYKESKATVTDSTDSTGRARKNFHLKPYSR